MHRVRWCIGFVALFLMTGWSLGAQSLDALGDSAPAVVAGDKVRVWKSPEFVFRLLPTIRLGFQPVRLVGTVMPRGTPDSLELRRTALILYPWELRHRTVFWGDVRHLDVAEGRNGAAGARRGGALGLLDAVIFGVMYSFLSHVICFDSKGGCGPSFATVTALAAAVTVPLGAIWGARSTKWRRVY